MSNRIRPISAVVFVFVVAFVWSAQAAEKSPEKLPLSKRWGTTPLDVVPQAPIR